MTTAAIAAAVETYSQPLVHRRPSRHQLPPGILDVIKIAARDEETISAAETAFAIKREVLVESAKFYLQNLLLDAGDNPYRLLCLPDGAPEKDVTTHKRWLLKWLHPDRNKNKWESVLFARVSQAATRIGENAGRPFLLANAQVSPSKKGQSADLGGRQLGHRRGIRQNAHNRRIVFGWRTFLHRNAVRVLAVIATLLIGYLIAYSFNGA